MGEAKRRKAKDPAFGQFPLDFNVFLRDVCDAFDAVLKQDDNPMGLFVILPPEQKKGKIAWVNGVDLDTENDEDARRLATTLANHPPPDWIILEMPDLHQAMVLDRAKTKQLLGIQ